MEEIRTNYGDAQDLTEQLSRLELNGHREDEGTRGNRDSDEGKGRRRGKKKKKKGPPQQQQHQQGRRRRSLWCPSIPPIASATPLPLPNNKKSQENRRGKKKTWDTSMSKEQK